MPVTPEDKARQAIDRLLEAAGWKLQDRKEADLSVPGGVTIREFPMPGYGEADYLLFVDGKALGVVEAKKEGETLTHVERQTEKYSAGLPDYIDAPVKPLPFRYESTGEETRFTNGLEPDAASRNIFAFHKPSTLVDWLHKETVKARLRKMPALAEEGLRAAQIKAIKNLEVSLARGDRRALIQMATGGGKTFTACNFIYRLIKYAGARRVLFLVDRNNLGRQALKEFQAFKTPDEQRPFTELYNVQHMQSNKLDTVSKVCITTIQRLYAMLRGEELDPDLEEQAGFTQESLRHEPPPVECNPNIPIETFDFIVTDECHRSIYNLWRQVLEYFDASIIGLTATPSLQTLGFFNRNLVMEYNFEQAVADGVNVDFDLYQIRTQISEHGSTIQSGFYVDFRNKETRRVRWEKADEDIRYDADELDRRVVSKDQIRIIHQTFRDKLFTEIFPGRTEVPKTLIFAKDDSHAEDIVTTVRDVFGKGNDFAQKITYKAGTVRTVEKVKTEDGTEREQARWVNKSGIKPEDLISSFRNSYNPRIAVTVDMIATGTDIKPLEIVFFMRAVRSRTLFEQMKGRGSRTISSDELRGVTGDAKAKDRFVLIDAVGIDPNELNETKPLERRKYETLKALLERVAFGDRTPDILSSVASRLARIDRQLTPDDQAEVEQLAGRPIRAIVSEMVKSLDPDVQLSAAKQATGKPEPSQEEIDAATKNMLNDVVRPIVSSPKLRLRLIEIRKRYEQIIDTVSQDTVTKAGFDRTARDRAETLIKSFEQFIEAHKNKITALQVLYSRPYKQRLHYDQIKELAQVIKKPGEGFRRMEPEQLWEAYEQLDKSKVRGSGDRVLSDIVSLVRYALHEKGELYPYREDVDARFGDWIEQQKKLGVTFTDEQMVWLEAIRDHVGTNIEIEKDDFDNVPFVQMGGLGKAYKLFGEKLQPLLAELNEVLVA
jgi:type I restriction enzyme R subunit